MANSRWDMGTPEAGTDWDQGAVSPWNGNVRTFSDYATLQTVPAPEFYDTMASQMDGDEHITWAPERGGRNR